MRTSARLIGGMGTGRENPALGSNVSRVNLQSNVSRKNYAARTRRNLGALRALRIAASARSSAVLAASLATPSTISSIPPAAAMRTLRAAPPLTTMPVFARTGLHQESFIKPPLCLRYRANSLAQKRIAVGGFSPLRTHFLSRRTAMRPLSHSRRSPKLGSFALRGVRASADTRRTVTHPPRTTSVTRWFGGATTPVLPPARQARGTGVARHSDEPHSPAAAVVTECLFSVDACILAVKQHCAVIDGTL
jgi:hypothetical protein